MKKSFGKISRVGLVSVLSAGVITVTSCDPGAGFLGLQDYQRDLLVGGLLAGVLLGGDSGAEPTATQGVPGADGAAGAPGSPGGDGAQGAAGADGEPGVAGPEGPTGPAGPAGPAGTDGTAGPSGAQGASGADGLSLFTIFVDDFFTIDGNPTGDLAVNFVSISEPELGSFSDVICDVGERGDECPEGNGTPNVVAYRVAIPEGYEAGNDVTMRLSFLRTGDFNGNCFIFTVDAARLRSGEDLQPYGQRVWVRVVGSTNDGAGVFVDLVINSPAGLDFPDDLAVADLVAFELSTHQSDGGAYHLLGVEFFESDGPAETDGALIIDSEEEACCVILDPAGPMVYISNTGSDTVWVVDMDSASVVAVIDVGDDPRGIDITPDSSRVYVANRFGGSVSVIDTATNTLIQTIDLEGSDIVSATEPYDVVVSPDGEWLYVAMKNGGSENGDGTVAVVDLPGGDVVAEVVLDENASLEGIVVTPDGQKVYAAGRGDMYIVDVSPPTFPTFLGTSGSAGRELVISPDGAWVYADNNAVRTSDDTDFLTGERSGERGIAISPDGRFLFSTDEGSNVKVVEIALVEGLPVTTFVANIDDVDNRQFEAYGIDLTDAGDRGVVSFRRSESIRIFDATTLSFVGPVIPLEFTTCTGETIFGDEPKQLVIDHTTN